MDDIWPDFTPVRHKKEHYSGWIDGTTRLKELFTGNTDSLWQYRVRIPASEARRVVPAEDLERVMANAEFPDFGFNGGNVRDGGFQQETRLHFLGYQISDKNHDERWAIILYAAVPILGLRSVLRTIIMLADRRMASTALVSRNKYALIEWKKDIDRICREFAEDPALKETFIVNGLRKLQADFQKYKI